MKIKIKSTGQEVEVYESKNRDTYINADNCTTEYNIKDVIVINK